PHPLPEDRGANVATATASQHLKTPAGRPASGTELPEAQAVARGIAEPADVVIARYRRMADEKPEDAERQFLLGRVYQTVGQLEAARTALERCRALGGLDGRVERPLGTVYVALKKPAEAREALGHYLAKHPEDGWSHLQLGKALADAGDDGGALKEFQRAISCDPELDEAQRLAGVALGRRGDEAEGFYRLAVASRLRGELEQALSHFQRTKPLLDPASPRRQEVDQAIAELLPLVHERERERLERRRGPRGGGPAGRLPLRGRARLRCGGGDGGQRQGCTGGDPPAAGSDRGGSRGLRPGLAILEAWGELRRDALLPADRHARASLALLARCAALGDGVHQRLPRRAPPRADRPAPRSLAGMARRLRARAVPVPAGDPARLPHGRGPGHQGLPASPPRPDQDAAPDRPAVDPGAPRLRGPAAQAMIRIAVIGAGQWGPNLIRNFHNRRTSEVAWVVDRDAGRLAQVRERFPDIRVDTDAETVMADGRIDAVVIATPTSTHHALAKRALGVGKHVLVEKPITADSAEAEELCSLAAQAGRILMVGHVFVYNPGVQHGKQVRA